MVHGHEHDGAQHGAVQAAGAAQHEDQQQLGRTRKAQHVDGDELRRLRQQRAGHAGISGAYGVDRNQPAIHRDTEGGHAQRILPDAAQFEAKTPDFKQAYNHLLNSRATMF